MTQSNARISHRASSLSSRPPEIRRDSRVLLTTLAALVVFAAGSRSADGAGISVDAGLTPAEDRWILRTQGMYTRRRSDSAAMDRKMSMYALRTVVAYGLRPDLTVMVRQAAHYRKMSMGGSFARDSGLGDLFLMGKYELFRRNTRESTFGIASTLGLEFPSGADAFTSDTWDLKPGLYTSWRKGSWATDFSASYKWNGFADRGRGGVNPGNELSLDWALARQFSIAGSADISVTPVLELSYVKIRPDHVHGHDVPSTGESVLYLSPGIKYTKSSFIVEALLQIPVHQRQRDAGLERGSRLLLGARWMF